ncbi:hypothetical protein AVDCRST_MAG92-390 [uncultured Coleofasciculus sp.]|uniref:Uncharacterized protein n=1 Tax=uncultured Coleofasciculus sp. TaxID=1267456 RepID=A0A6J4H7Z0_9CYAN|nr:hypothetical protein AVDCRST_MAG92-390 [uncultured Coleofasciculus sp.]
MKLQIKRDRLLRFVLGVQVLNWNFLAVEWEGVINHICLVNLTS